MAPPITAHECVTARHTTRYLSAELPDGPLIVFVHGWPELAISWRHLIECFAALGFHVVAPDMRGYGGSTVHTQKAAYSMAEISQDMVELLAHLGRDKAIWVGHDWGSPVVWSMASHHADKCLGVASLCVPYMPRGFTLASLVPLVDRNIYPEDVYPAGQWDYQVYYQERFDDARAALEADILRTVKALMRSGAPEGRGKPYRTAMMRGDGGWFGGAGIAPDLPHDPAVVTEEALAEYVERLATNGFFGPDAWYANMDANTAFAATAPADGRLAMPVLFLHAAYDWICETLDSQLAAPMRLACSNLSEAVVESGHWMQQEKPERVNACLAAWIDRRIAPTLGLKDD